MKSSTWITLLLLALTATAGAPTDTTKTADPAPLCLDEWGAFVAGRPSYLQPMSVAASPDGFVYVLDWEGSHVLKFTQDGTFMTSWNVPSTFHRSGSRTLNAIAVSDRAVYVSDMSDECIQQFTPDGKRKGRIPYEAGLNGLAVDPLGDLYVGGFHVLAVDTSITPPTPGTGGPRSAVPDTFLEATKTEGPALWKLNRLGEALNHWSRNVGAVAVDHEGLAYVVTELFPNGPVSILQLSPLGGRLAEWEVGGLGQAAYRAVNAMAVGAQGHVFLTSARMRKIVELNAKGEWTRAWNSAGPERRIILEPVGAAVDTSGCLYVTDFAVSRVVKYDPRKSP